MDSADYLVALEDKARSFGFETFPDAVGDGVGVIVGRRVQQRLTSRVYAYLIASRFDSDTSLEKLERYLDDSIGYSIDNYSGIGRGMQSGTATICVAVIADANTEIQQWATRAHGGRWAAVPFPVIVDPANSIAIKPRPRSLGLIFYSYLSRVFREVVAAPLR